MSRNPPPAVHATIEFERISDRLGRLNVRRSGSPFGLTSRERFEYQLGLCDLPLYRLEQPSSPDDPWSFEPTGNGAWVPADEALVPELEQTYLPWASGGRAAAGHAVLQRLPHGSYFVVRSPLRPSVERRVLFGNELVPATPNLRVLVDDDSAYSFIVGCQLDSAPDLNQPLVGITILDYLGAPSPTGIVFFPCTATTAPDLGGSADLVLVIPQAGELVLDSMSHFSGHDVPRCRERWSRDSGRQFADLCGRRDPRAR
jgi:hypothetical protein